MAKHPQRTRTHTERRKSSSILGHEPLYKRAKRALIHRISSGEWRPSQMIPSEMELAAELKISQGTVRKALDEMTADHLLVRSQGRGTFVSSFDDEKMLFQFFRIVPDGGTKTFPDSLQISLSSGPATDEDMVQFDLRQPDDIWRLERSRSLADAPIMFERISLPMSRFPELGEMAEIPNNVYGLYAEKFGVTIVRAVEQLKAVSAGAVEAQHLQCQVGDPVLRLSRRAYDLDDRVVEWRVSLCVTTDVHYAASIR